MKDENNKDKFVIYDRQWRFLRFINPSILDEPRLHSVYTQVDNDGMIVILAIIPGDGNMLSLMLEETSSTLLTVRPVKTRSHISYFSLNEFKVLSSGEIVCPSYDSFMVIHNLQSEAKVREYKNWPMFSSSKWTADTLINVLYRCYQCSREKGFAVDQVFADNAIKAKEIITIASWIYANLHSTSMIITPSGKLVLMNGSEMRVFSHSA